MDRYWYKDEFAVWSEYCDTTLPNYITISDNNFKKALLNHSPRIDLNRDGKISEHESEIFTGIIDVEEQFITDISGIEFFKSITGLNCSKNEIKVLDISKNTALTTLICSFNQIENIDVSKNIALRLLIVMQIKLKKLDLKQNIHLLNLWCHENEIRYLDLSKSP